MSTLQCEKCGAAMAPAEEICVHCGAPAPAGKSALLLMSRADKAWNDGAVRDAVSLMDRALKSGLPPQELPLGWRKLGLWLEKQQQMDRDPALLARAGQAFKNAIGLNDADEVAHQLFIANSGKQGQLILASDFYKARLAADPADAVALKQMNVIKLSADFLAQRPPSLAPIEPQNALERWLKPSPWKVISAGITLASSLVMIVVSLIHGKVAGGPVGDMIGLGTAMGMPVDLNSLLFDPSSWALQGSLSALLLYIMYRNR